MPAASLLAESAALHARVQGWFTPPALRTALGLGEHVIERIALDWLAKDGKRWRPFLAMAVFQAVSDLDRDEALARSIAIALEAIHKASLIYDDVQDADEVRYGAATVHAVHGVPVALSASLLLIGHGYRMLAECAATDAARVAMLRLATRGHCDLCLGQGGELAWMNAKRPLSVAEVLDFHRWKTAPSFDVVFRLPLYASCLDADAIAALEAWCLTIGTAYQIADDLDDWHGQGDVDDLAMGRPDLVLAVAHEAAAPAERQQLAAAWCGQPSREELTAARALALRLQAPERTRALLDQHLRTAATRLAAVAHPGLRACLEAVTALIFRRK